MVHLDTNFLIQALVVGTPASTKLSSWLMNAEDVGFSTIAWSEFLCGPVSPYERSLAESLFSVVEPFTAQDAEKAAELFNLTGRRSRSLADCQIAAIALRCNVELATVNKNDFKVFESNGLKLILL